MTVVRGPSRGTTTTAASAPSTRAVLKPRSIGREHPSTVAVRHGALRQRVRGYARPAVRGAEQDGARVSVAGADRHEDGHQRERGEDEGAPMSSGLGMRDASGRR